MYTFSKGFRLNVPLGAEKRPGRANRRRGEDNSNDEEDGDGYAPHGPCSREPAFNTGPRLNGKVAGWFCGHSVVSSDDLFYRLPDALVWFWTALHPHGRWLRRVDGVWLVHFFSIN